VENSPQQQRLQEMNTLEVFRRNLTESVNLLDVPISNAGAFLHTIADIDKTALWLARPRGRELEMQLCPEAAKTERQQ
jgi:hypothetical protein